MSEPRLISPLLDGFIMGEPMSDHHGVRCCPAIRENTDERYIVKIISIPASQVQLDALLLSGAYADQSEALAYFKELSEGVTGEADILTRLSQLEGYVPCLGHQIEQMEDGVGYEVYLISPYRRSLEKQMRLDPPTHLGAVNLGLDLCAALTVCRQAGYLYADLKPGNIFITENQGYRIGDLGFIPLASLKYASLPEKYRSSYTAPEITDAMAALNDTIDIYALGLTLYQVYNNGQLPFEGSAPAEPLPPPLYADYEMAEIILKACAPAPADRWQDPAQMGQALVNYMQRNSVNDTPIVPPPVELEEEPEEEIEEFLSEDENEAELAELLEQLPEEEPPAEEPVEETEPEPDTTEPAEEAEDLSFIEEAAADETLPTEESAAELEDASVTDEVAEMLAQADELISHELPEPVVAPDPIDVPIPPPILPEPEETPEEPEDSPADDEESPKPDEESAEPEEAPDEELPEPESQETEETREEEDEIIFAPNVSREKKKKKRRKGPWIALAAALVLLAGLAFGGYYYYNEYYLQTIDALTVDGTEDEITVSITTDIDESLLTVVCTDTYGNTQRSPVTAGSARFASLNPGTQYRIQVVISGSHKLLGSTTGTYTTATQTEILNFSATSGPEDGSVILSFSVNGPETEGWSMEYSASGIAAETLDFSGHTVTITGLTVGTDYTFRLIPKTELYLTGTYELNFTARKIVYAQNLTVTACGGGSLTAQWSLPEGSDAQNWVVRCYNDAGYDQTITTMETSAQFDGLDHSTGYTVKVTAEGMTQSVTATVTANPITVTGFTADTSVSGVLALTWAIDGEAPANGWVLTYTIDGGTPQILSCANNAATVPLYPGSHYEFSLQPVDAVTFCGEGFIFDAPDAAAFEGYLVSAEDMVFSMCRTPDETNWDRHDLKDSDYKTAFSIGEKASFLVRLREQYNTSDDTIVTTYIIRDAEGRPVSMDTQSRTWTKMWYKSYCELDIPQMPATAGSYSIEIYFNDLYVTTQYFTVT